MIQLRTTLFPYTTLFRSHIGLHLEDDGIRHRLLIGRMGEPERDIALAGAGRFHLRDLEPVIGSGGMCRCRLKCCDRDRKSTRLNSSHSSISYAVFLLKKK